MSDHHDYWHVNYNSTLAAQDAKGWTGVGLVLALNLLVFSIGIGLFSLSRSGRSSLYCVGEEPPELPGVSIADMFLHFVHSFRNVSALHYEIGDEGAFFLLYQLNAFRLLVFMSVIAIFVLIPVYYLCADFVVTEFEQLTIRTLRSESPWLWVPVIVCWTYSMAFGAFIFRLYQHYTNRDASNGDLLCMRPSNLSARSVFVNRGLPESMGERRLASLLKDVGYPSCLAAQW